MAPLRSLPSTVPTILILIFLVNVSTLTINDALDDAKRAAHQDYEIELLIAADYSFFKNWFDKTNSTYDPSNRTAQAKQMVERYIGTLINGANVVYKSLEPYNIHMRIKLVDIIIATTPNDSSWTESIKFQGSPTYRVESTRVLALFQPQSVHLQSTIPHDHAMVLTSLDLADKSGVSVMAGYAYMDAECKAKSVSVVEDNRDFYTAQLIAHELGHSLGASHDGVGNNCVQGYAMEGTFLYANRYKWIFSTCAVYSIRQYLTTLNRTGNNCLKSTENHSPGPEMSRLASQQFGTVYSADDQCSMIYGQGSYLCRELYHDAYTYDDICLRLFCYHPGNQTCYFIDAGNGTPCGNGKWCYAGVCIANGNAPIRPEISCAGSNGDLCTVYKNSKCCGEAASRQPSVRFINVSKMLPVRSTCPVGDQSGSVKNGLTCSELVHADPSQCTDRKIRFRCCATCNANKNSTLNYVANLSIDQQCVNKVGTGSHMCRGGTAYDNVAYSDTVCSDMQCMDPSNTRMCISKTADDGTPCGNKKWCINGACVTDTQAPTVSDTCPWGDAPGVVTYGLRCSELSLSHHHWRCNDRFSSKVCCGTCERLKTNSSGCPYGDKSDWCRNNIRSVRDRRKCYIGNNADLCCGTCGQYSVAGIPGCEFGDRSDWCSINIQSRADSRACYYGNEDLCCETCHRHRNATQTGCEYGDRVGNCHASDCLRYPLETRMQCCESCHTTSIMVG